MALITIQVIEGLERGQIFEDVPTPVSIGREDDNRVRLNDERVSRFHAKIQEDAGRVILTDLESTNGTRVNGQPVQMRVLQVGDQLSIGRCLLIYGSREQIAARFDDLHAAHRPLEDKTVAGQPPGSDWDNEDVSRPNVRATALFPGGPPPVPEGLRPGQRAELSDLLAYVHEQIEYVIQYAHEANRDAAEPEADAHPLGAMSVPWIAWQRLLMVEMDLAASMRKVADPDG